MLKMKRPLLLSTLSQKGQTTIPQAVRKELGIKEGDVIQYELEKNTVRLRKLERIDTEWAKALESWLDKDRLLISLKDPTGVKVADCEHTKM